MMWNITEILIPLFIMVAGFYFGECVAHTASVPQSDTVESELARWREKYAHAEISLPALEKTVEKVLATGGEYGRNTWR